MKAVKEILVENGLDFTITKVPLFGMVNDGFLDADKYGLYNDKTKQFVGYVGKSYAITQNEEIVQRVVDGMENYGQLSVHKAYSIDGGAKVAIQLAIDGNSVVNGDAIQRFVTIIDSNDGSSSLSVGIGNKTMSCQNMFYQFARKGQIKARHTQSITKKVISLTPAIGNALADSMKIVDLYRKFDQHKLSEIEANNFKNTLVKELIGFNIKDDLTDKKTRGINIMNSLYDNINHQMAEKGNTLWGLHSGVTRFTTHDKSAPRRENGREEMMMVGNGNTMNQISFDFAKYQM